MYKHQEGFSGPIRNRRCTDVFCLFIFVAFWIFIGYLSVFAYSKGKFSNIAKPIDSDQMPCGEGNRKDYPILYLTDPTSVKFYQNTVCVKKCPETDADKLECFVNQDITSCDDVDVKGSITLFGRVCLPHVKTMANYVKEGIHMSYIQEAIEDVKEVWPMVLVGIVIGCLILAVYLYLIRLCTKVFIYLLVILILVALVGSGVYCWREYKQILRENADIQKIVKEGSLEDPEDPNANIKEEESTDFGNQQAGKWKTAAIIFWVIAGVYFILILFMIGRINIAADILESAAEFVQEESSVFTIPLIFTILLLIFLIYWIFTFSLMSSVGELKVNEHSIFMDIKKNDNVKLYCWILVFALLWGISFNFSQETFSIAAMSSSWYFHRHDNSHLSPLTPVSWSFTYHVGTLAFGSLLIAILWMIQLVLSYIYQKLKETGQDQTAVGFIVKCAACFVACFERTIKFINKHAYIETAIRNLNFCPAAAKCLEVTTKNFLRFGVMSGLTELFLFMGSIFVTCVSTFVMHQMIKRYCEASGIEVTTIGPLAVIFLGTISICIIFSHVYEISADTLLHCYILDEEDGVIDGQVGGKCPEKLMSTVKLHSEIRQD